MTDWTISGINKPASKNKKNGVRKQMMICPTCNGHGESPLPEHLAETFALIPKRGSTCAEALHEQLPGASPNAQNNRLEKLRALGLVSRVRDGKRWKYSRV